ncbi:hypothetical protein E4U12_003710 [Claviceps purpurea]|nr:hypothetical protein E4U12_003710 [Claviceps purpurea]
MSHESASNNVPEEGSKDGRQWTNAEVFAFLGFLNNERNEGALRNTTAKFMAPTLKKEISDASGTERKEKANCFTVSDIQRAGFMSKYDARGGRIINSGLLTNNLITIDTYSNIFSDEPDAGRQILPAKVVTNRRNPPDGSAIPVDADDARISDLDEPQPADLDPTVSTTGSRTSTATPSLPATPIPKPSRVAKASSEKKTSKAKASKTAGTEANAIANAHLRDPESQTHMLALRDASRTDHGFSPSLTTAILLWIQTERFFGLPESMARLP